MRTRKRQSFSFFSSFSNTRFFFVLFIFFFPNSRYGLLLLFSKSLSFRQSRLPLRRRRRSRGPCRGCRGLQLRHGGRGLAPQRLERQPGLLRRVRRDRRPGARDGGVEGRAVLLEEGHEGPFEQDVCAAGAREEEPGQEGDLDLLFLCLDLGGGGGVGRKEGENEEKSRGGEFFCFLSFPVSLSLSLFSKNQNTKKKKNTSLPRRAEARTAARRPRGSAPRTRPRPRRASRTAARPRTAPGRSAGALAGAPGQSLKRKRRREGAPEGAGCGGAWRTRRRARSRRGRSCRVFFFLNSMGARERRQRRRKVSWSRSREREERDRKQSFLQGRGHSNSSLLVSLLSPFRASLPRFALSDSLQRTSKDAQHGVARSKSWDAKEEEGRRQRDAIEWGAHEEVEKKNRKKMNSALSQPRPPSFLSFSFEFS